MLEISVTFDEFQLVFNLLLFFTLTLVPISSNVNTYLSLSKSQLTPNNFFVALRQYVDPFLFHSCFHVTRLSKLFTQIVIAKEHMIFNSSSCFSFDFFSG